MNGKIDRNQQFSYSIAISFAIFLILIFIAYQIMA
jgi:hypothetical protein